MKIAKNNSISLRLSVHIFILSVFLSLIFTSLQFTVKYRNEIKKTEDKLREIKDTQLDNIELQLWNMDRPALKIILEGLVALPDISYAKIESLNNEIYSRAGVPNKEYSLKKNFDLSFKAPKREPENIGKLSIYISRSKIINRLFQGAVLIILTQSLQIFIVAFCVFFITQFIIIEPLHNMAEYTKGFDLSRLDKELKLNRKFKPQKNDDIDLVAEAINRMRESIKNATLALREKLKMEGEFNAASKIQQYSLIDRSPEIKGFMVSLLYSPGKKVSGDFYDIIQPDDDNMVFLTGDVSGKGLASSLTAHTARILLRSRQELLLNPKRLFSFLNRILTDELPANYFITFSYIILNIRNSSLIMFNFGHEPSLLFKSRENSFIEINPKGYPISKLHTNKFDDNINFKNEHIEKNDILILYTDGLTDTLGFIYNSNGEDILKEIIINNKDKSSQEIKRIIKSNIETDIFLDENDDITLIIIKKED